MATTTFDVDSNGLMEEIQRLIAPPVSNHEKKNKQQRGDVARVEKTSSIRPKGLVNRQFCDYCEEGGELLCCDTCPAAFHLQCHDPPLDEDAVPYNTDWFCHQCRVRESQKVVERANGGSVSPPLPEQVPGVPAPPPPVVEPKAKVPLIPNGTNGNGCAPASDKSAPFIEAPLEMDLVEGEDPLKTLIRAAKMLNPREFELPQELECTTRVPGSCKRRWWEETRKGKKTHYEVDNGLVPLPAQSCCTCHRSCRVAPLVKCSYCPLLYHADCLNPPLSTLPTGKWMCPGHVEHHLDAKFLRSTSLTERVQLWNEYQQPLEETTVKLQFLNRIHRKWPPFRVKRRMMTRAKVTVPSAIKNMYRYPPTRWPSGQGHGHVDGEQVQPYGAGHESTAGVAAGETGLQRTMTGDEEQWLTGVISLQTSLALNMAAEQVKAKVKAECSNNGANGHPVTNGIRSCSPLTFPFSDRENELARSCDSPMANGPTSGRSTPFSLCGGDDVVKPSDIIKAKLEAKKGGVGGPAGGASGGRSYLAQAMNASHPDPVEEKNGACAVDDNDDRDNRSGVSTASNNSLVTSLLYSLERCMDGKLDEELNHIQQKLIRVLAYQRLQQLVPSRSRLRSTMTMAMPASTGSHEVAARASLCCLATSGKGPVLMRYRKLTIGNSSSCDLCLKEFGHCDFVDDRHAAIYFDELSRRYELLNYSDHGTVVDQVLYCCAYPSTEVKRPPMNQLVEDIKKTIHEGGKHKRKRKQPAKKENTVPMMNSGMRRSGSCRCRVGPSQLLDSSVDGWEGPAQLHHGSMLQFGCLSFVFSVTEQAPPCLLTSSAISSSSSSSMASC